MSIPCSLRATALVAVATAAPALGVVACAFADDGGGASPAPAAAPAAPATPRYAALDQEIRRLERHLAVLRKARAELAAGRSEPVPLDEAARREHDAQARAFREMQRYESSRAKAVAQYVEATSPGKDGKTDDAKAADARASVEQIDRGFLAAMAKIDAPPASVSPKADAPKADAPKKPAADADDTAKKPEGDGSNKKKPRTKKVADGGDDDSEDDEG